MRMLPRHLLLIEAVTDLGRPEGAASGVGMLQAIIAPRVLEAQRSRQRIDTVAISSQLGVPALRGNTWGTSRDVAGDLSRQKCLQSTVALDSFASTWSQDHNRDSGGKPRTSNT